MEFNIGTTKLQRKSTATDRHLLPRKKATVFSEFAA